ncbi:MAG: endonuclease/exonuclease/phosphatase family protein [bacterium]
MSDPLPPLVDPADSPASIPAIPARKPSLSLWGLFGALMAVISIASIAGLGTNYWWPLENAAVFKVQYCLLLVLGALVYGFGKRSRAALLLGVLALINGAAFLPLYVGRDHPQAAAPQLRIMICNVYMYNTEYSKVLDLIAHEQPDVIVFAEVTPEWVSHLAPLKAEYPYVLAEPEDGAMGLAFCTRVPPESLTMEHYGLVRNPTAVARFRIDGHPLTVIGTHPVPPLSADFVAWRNSQMNEIADTVARESGAVIVAGDLNMTSESPVFQHLCQIGKLHDSRRGFGPQASWPSDEIYARIAIDHCLVSRQVQVHNRRLGPAVGSDHWPVIIDIAVTQ